MNNIDAFENLPFMADDADYNVTKESDLSLTRIEEEYNSDSYDFFPDASF